MIVRRQPQAPKSRNRIPIRLIQTSPALTLMVSTHLSARWENQLQVASGTEFSFPTARGSSCAFTTLSYWRQPQDASSLAIPSGLMATRLTHDGSEDIGAKFIKTGEMQLPKLIR